MSDPRPVYSQLLEQRRVDIAHDEHRHRILGYCKLAVVVGGAALVWLALLNRSISIIWALIPAALLAALAMFHERVLRHQDRLRRAEHFFEQALARLDGNWPGTGEPGDRYLTPSHPNALDQDLFGKGSLFELLSTARTHVGEVVEQRKQILAHRRHRLLSEHHPLAVVVARQRADQVDLAPFR